MSQVVFGYIFCLLTALVVISGDFVLKLAADKGLHTLSGYVFVGCAIYAFSAIMWFYAMQHVSLAQAGVAYSMLTLLALCAIGAFWFNEPIGLREMLGIGCAILSMILMVRIA